MDVFKNTITFFGVIGSLGFILLVSLFLSAILEGLNSKLFSHFSNHTIYLVFASQNLINLFIIMLLFGVIFKVLPDANVTWKQVRVSSLTTAVLFMFGKFLISYYISNSHLGSAYGAAGSLVIIMVSAYSDSETLLKALNSVIQGYIVKPITSNKVKNILEKIDYHQNKEHPNQKIKLNDFVTLDLLNSSVIVNDKIVYLTKKEMLFLNLLFDILQILFYRLFRF